MVRLLILVALFAAGCGSSDDKKDEPSKVPPANKVFDNKGKDPPAGAKTNKGQAG
jgi:hypothetical protein